jgi:hypothetical protein
MWKDLRHGARTLLRDKGWTAIVVLSLALGIGANTALFSAVNSLFLRVPNGQIWCSVFSGIRRCESDNVVLTSFIHNTLRRLVMGPASRSPQPRSSAAVCGGNWFAMRCLEDLTATRGDVVRYE